VKKSLFVLFSVLVVSVMVLAACTTPTAAPTAAPVVTEAPTEAPTEVPMPEYVTCGTPEDPCVITFVPSADTGKITVAGNQIADYLAVETGLNFEIEVGTSFAASIEAMGAEKAQIGFLNTFSILLGEAKYGIDPALASVRPLAVVPGLSPDEDLKGTPQPYYRGQFIAKVDSGITTLADLAGKTFCFGDINSTSSYIVPNILLKAAGLDYEAGDFTAQFAGSHSNVAIAVYDGTCDAGVTFIDVITSESDNLAATYPDIVEVVKQFAVTDIIPNDGIQFVKNFDPELRATIVAALLKMSVDEVGKTYLTDLYNIKGLTEITPDFYDTFAAALKAAGVDPATLVK
jgi:phosphonate transport system substrate-binding protein